MSLMPQQTPLVSTTPAETLESLLYAANAAARDGAGSSDPEERSKLAQAALAFTQAYVALDPTVVAPQGVPPDALHPPQHKPDPRREKP